MPSLFAAQSAARRILRSDRTSAKPDSTCPVNCAARARQSQIQDAGLWHYVPSDTVRRLKLAVQALTPRGGTQAVQAYADFR